jgi:hypothetical protein
MIGNRQFAGLAMCCALALATVQAVAARTEWMSEAELAASFNGVTLNGRYADGREFTERYLASGRIEYLEREIRIGGLWSIRSGTFCTIYDADPAGGCYRVHRESENCYEFYFVARTQEQAEHDPRKPSWTARGAIEGKSPTCDDDAAV